MTIEMKLRRESFDDQIKLSSFSRDVLQTNVIINCVNIRLQPGIGKERKDRLFLFLFDTVVRLSRENRYRNRIGFIHRRHHH